jgi:hypothetical protein
LQRTNKSGVVVEQVFPVHMVTGKGLPLGFTRVPVSTAQNCPNVPQLVDAEMQLEFTQPPL